MKSQKLSSPEDQLKALRKLDGNKICPNCGTVSDFGFGSVCVKYKTFVCDLCKTSHQAISHRVKSVTMSTWTADEVHELTDNEGGGNDAARHVWLANAPAFGARYAGGVRPKQGERVEVFKQFVVDCYEHGKFRSSEPYQSKSVTVTKGNSTASTPPPTVAATSSKQVPAVVVKQVSVPIVPQVSVPMIDLLDDGALPVTASQPQNTFDPFATSTTVTPPSSTVTKNDDIWSSFLSAPSAPLPASSAPATTATSSVSNDPFAGNSLLGLTAPQVNIPPPTFSQSQPTTPHGSFHASQQQQQQLPMQEHVKRSTSAPSFTSPQWNNSTNSANAISNLMVNNSLPSVPPMMMGPRGSAPMMMYPNQAYVSPMGPQSTPQYQPNMMPMYNSYNGGMLPQQPIYGSQMTSQYPPQYNNNPPPVMNNYMSGRGNVFNGGGNSGGVYSSNTSNGSGSSASTSDRNNGQDPAFGFVQNLLNK